MDDKGDDLVPPPPPIISSSTKTSPGGGGASTTAPSAVPGLAEGDWNCPDCGNINFARRTSCNRCHKSRGTLPPIIQSSKKRKLGHEIGKAAAEKSRGLFSADDWQCTKCGNVNWARRQQCNVCNAPKFGEVEERTGFGGGYNDRGVVEYKEHTESDDEYDEFGRRKKRRRHRDYDQGGHKTYNDINKDGNERNKKEEEDEEEQEEESVVDNKQEKEKEVEENEEEDEDEDDDEDGDLSKYDLSDWGDSCESNKINNSKSGLRSRSRSRSPDK